jgi:nucleoredoxin
MLFVSSDRSEREFDEYFAEMSFAAMPYDEREKKAAIASKLQVRGIPTLMIFGPVPQGACDRQLINGHVRGMIEQGDYIASFPFQPKPYGDLNTTTDNINNYKSVIVFHEGGDDEEQAEIQRVLQRAAEVLKVVDTELKFFWAFSISGLSKTVREALQLGAVGENPVLIILDIPNQGRFYVSEAKEISIDAVVHFVQYPGEVKQLQ